ncbi:hypothetical protein Nmel_013911 [Mimus melanotis]
MSSVQERCTLWLSALSLWTSALCHFFQQDEWIEQQLPVTEPKVVTGT